MLWGNIFMNNLHYQTAYKLLSRLYANMPSIFVISVPISDARWRRLHFVRRTHVHQRLRSCDQSVNCGRHYLGDYLVKTAHACSKLYAFYHSYQLVIV